MKLNTRKLFALNGKALLIFLLFIGGCAKHQNPGSEMAQSRSVNPTDAMCEKGIWTGEGKLVTLYEHNGKSVQALSLIISPGQVKKWTIGDKPVLVDKQLKLIDPEAYVGKMLKVKGMISPECPLNPNDGAQLLSVDLTKADKSNEYLFTFAEVIKLDPKKILVLGPANTTSK